MASSSRKVSLLGKRKPEDDMENKPFLKKHKEKKTKCDEANIIPVEGVPDFGEEVAVKVKQKTLFVANVSSQTQVSDIIDFFKDVAQVVHVRLILDYKGQHVGYGYVEFASANEAKMALEKKNGGYLQYCKIILDEVSYFVEEIALPKKTLIISHLCRHTTDISDIIDFFKDVGRVIRVRLVVNLDGYLLGSGFVEFASANEAKKALQTKNGADLHDRRVFLDVFNGYLPPPKYCIDHKVWYEEHDLQQQERLPIEDADSAEVVLLIANLSPQTTRIMHIIRFFEDVAEVVSVRLIVNHEGKHVGYGFVEFESSYEAKKALEEKNGEYLHDHKILLMKGFDNTPNSFETVDTLRKKTLYVDNLSSQTEISDIINLFRDVAQVDHVRLFVDQWGNRMGYGFVGFTSANEAKKALEKNGEYLHYKKIVLDVSTKGAKYHQRHCIDHKVWYDDHLQRVSLVIKEDAAAVEGLDETPDFAEEVAVRKKTIFVAELSNNLTIENVVSIFKSVGEVVRVRVILDHWGEYVGCFFVEMATANEAEKVVFSKDGLNFFVNVAERDRPYPFRPKYNVADFAETLWYEDNLLRKSLPKRGKPTNGIKPFKGERITFSDSE